VSIGTSSPGERLHVFSGGAEFAIQWDSTGSKSWALGSASTRAYIRNKTDSVETLTILNAGNVGIGVTSPSAKLEVAGGVSGQQVAGRYFGFGTGTFAFDSTTVNDYGMSYTQPGDGTFNTVLAGFSTIKFATNQTERMRITSAGRVGINGITNPAVNLDVNVSARATGTGGSFAQLTGGNVDGANIQLNRAGSGTQSAFLSQFQGTFFLKNIDSGPIAFTTTTGDFERMRITSAGNLLLGTSASPTTGDQCLTIETGTAPTATPADTISVYSSDLSAGNTMLSIYTEGTSVNANTTAAATHRIAVRINGTVYYLLANTAA
jgi:hypothetical protein